jgi:sulfur-oxidizing protein SoxZ
MVQAGSVIDVRVTLQHVMETGFRADAVGRVVPRDIVRQFSADFNGRRVFAADLHPAIAANPYLAFSLRVAEAGELRLTWRGDNGFSYSETLRISLV